MTYAEARALAQRAANEDGFDRGLEWLGGRGYGDYHVFTLPRRDGRYGHERRCEVVSCEDLARCRPGHGPEARDSVPAAERIAAALRAPLGARSDDDAFRAIQASVGIRDRRVRPAAEVRAELADKLHSDARPWLL